MAVTNRKLGVTYLGSNASGDTEEGINLICSFLSKEILIAPNDLRS